MTGLTTRGSPTLRQDIELNPLVDGGPTGQDFAGIGAYLATAPNGVTFGSRPPARRAGRAPRGRPIRRIDGADASAYTVAECMQYLRGPEGSRVSVEVERGGQRVDVVVQRRAIML